jgi:DNA-nicking Smr family endonuclease
VRSLSPEESALWSRVASTIRPLSRDTNDPAPIEAGPQTSLHHKVAASPARAPAREPQRKKPVGTTLDSSWDRRLRSGSYDPDRIVDLHGLGLDRAWRAIDRALEEAIARGDRLLLLITGHQREGEPPIRRGAIRSAVHDWLAASRHSGEIAAVRGAHRRHGGGGSLYIILRRSNKGR